MAADGSIVFDVQIDDQQAQKELNRLNRRIQTLTDQIYSKQKLQMPLVEQSRQLAAQLDAAKVSLQNMQGTGGVSFNADQISDQRERVRLLQAEWNKVQGKVDRYEDAIRKATTELEIAKTNAGEMQQRLAAGGTSSERMTGAFKRANAQAKKFTQNIRSAVGMSFLFSFAFQAMSSFTEWVGKVIQVNDEASAAVARLRAAFLTLAQPLLNIIIPAFTTLANILTDMVMGAAALVSTLFGSTVENSKEAAEGLYEETSALEETGKAAEEASKSLAAFDEINKLSDSTKTATKQDPAEGIQPDFAGLEEGNSWIANMMSQVAGWVPVALMLGGIALIAIGAAMGSLLLVTAGLGILGFGILSAVENEQLQSWAETLGLDNVQEFVVLAVLLGGIAITAIGASMGNILMVVSGLALIGITVAYATQSGMMQDWAETLGLSRAAQYVTAALLIGGMALVVIGAVTRNYLMIVAGLGLLSAGIYVGAQSGVLQSWWDALQLSGAAGWVTAGLLIAGMAFVVFGIALRNIAMVITGVGLFAAGVAVGSGSGTFESWWEVLQLPQAQSWVTSALLIGGIALTVIGIVTANIAMFIGGLAMIFAGINYGGQSGTFDNWWDVLGLEHADSYVTAALLIGGMALVVFGIVTANVLMVIGGLALLGVAAVYGSSTGTFESWSDALHLDDVAGKVTAAIMLAGIALIGIGASTLNPVLVLAGLALLGVGAIGNYLTGDGGTGSARSRMLTAPNFQAYDVPALARGAVIPPNREFLAVLGDQKNGTNIEAPVSEIEAAVARGMQKYVGTGSGQQTVILEVDKKVLGRVTYQVNKEESRRIGVDLVGV